MNGVNGMAPIVGEYLDKKRLAKLGYVFDSDDLSTFKAECFRIIDNEINSIKHKKSKNGAAKSRKR